MTIEAMKQLIEDCISMMEYHVEQTRPIHTTTVAIQAAKEALQAIGEAEQNEPFEYWNAVEGWVKIDEVRRHFDSVGCGTIYKRPGEGRVPLYLAQPKAEQEPPSGFFSREAMKEHSDFHPQPKAEKQEQGEPDDEVLGFNGWGFPIEHPPKPTPANKEQIREALVFNLPLYTTPQQRTWVGLNLDDVPEIYVDDTAFLHGAQWAEAKLKEKNFGE